MPNEDDALHLPCYARSNTFEDLVLGTHYMRYSPPPLGAFCIVEERISPRGIQLNLGLTEEASFSMDLP